jgi:hypothetical protein
MLHNYARDRKHHKDDLLLPEVDAELADAPVDPLDDANFITSVQVTDEWNNFRDQHANNMFDEYLLRRGELEIE